MLESLSARARFSCIIPCASAFAALCSTMCGKMCFAQAACSGMQTTGPVSHRSQSHAFVQRACLSPSPGCSVLLRVAPCSTLGEKMCDGICGTDCPLRRPPPQHRACQRSCCRDGSVRSAMHARQHMHIAHHHAPHALLCVAGLSCSTLCSEMYRTLCGTLSVQPLGCASRSPCCSPVRRLRRRCCPPLTVPGSRGRSEFAPLAP